MSEKTNKIKEINMKRQKIEVGKNILQIIKHTFKEEKAIIFVRELSKVDFAYYDGSFNWLCNEEVSIEELLEIRAFNKGKELLISRRNGHFIGRLIEDGQGEKYYVKPQKCYMWGREVIEKDNYYEIKEKKGTSYHLPKIINLKDATDFKYEVNNYMRQNQEDGTLYGIDYRLVAIYKTINNKDYSILDGGELSE